MNPVNMAKHRNNPNMPFWKMIKEGYDHFEVTRQEPKVDFCEKKYVFDATKAPDAKRDPVFDASAKCPAYVIPEDIASAVREKDQRDQAEYNKLVSPSGTPVARMNTGIDGGMNKIFASKIPEGSTGLSERAEGSTLEMLAMSKAPGTIPGTVNPPKPNLEAIAAAPQEEPVVAVSAPATNTRVATAQPAEKSGGFFSNLGRKMGMGTADTTATTPPPPQATASVAPAHPADRRIQAEGRCDELRARPRQVRTEGCAEAGGSSRQARRAGEAGYAACRNASRTEAVGVRWCR